VPHLASHILGLTIKELKKDWPRLFNAELLLLETFVDPRTFKGTSYKAANWRFLGSSFGSTKQGAGYIYHGVPKEVYVYVLNKNFRHIIGCTQKPCDLFHRPPQQHSLKKVEDLHMLLQQSQWHPGLDARMHLTEADLLNMADELIGFHKQFHSFYGRIEQKRLGMAYLSGLLSNAQAKSVEPIALEFLDKHAVRSLQRFMKECIWDNDGMQTSHQHMLSEEIRDPAGMINVDSSEFAKKGTESVGVARQYCGQLGKVDNCQSGVFVGYASPKGYGLLSCRLYMPELWFSKDYEQRRKDNLVPPDLTFQTKPRIALDLINEIVATNLFPAQWIGCDATFGQDSNFLKQLPSHLYYFAAIGSDTRVFLKKPKTGLPAYTGKGPRPKKTRLLPGQAAPETVAALAGSKRLRWQPVILAEGAKGPIVAEVVCKRVYLARGGLPENTPVCLFIRKTQDGQIKYAISNAPSDMAFSELCRASTMRWPIEQCFKEGKDQLGMDKYEHRSWPAWHRHMLYVFLAQHFLLKLRLRFKKNSLFNAASSAYAPGSHVAAALC
jgi:SRSO17 transposase